MTFEEILRSLLEEPIRDWLKEDSNTQKAVEIGIFYCSLPNTMPEELKQNLLSLEFYPEIVLETIKEG